MDEYSENVIIGGSDAAINKEEHLTHEQVEKLVENGEATPELDFESEEVKEHEERFGAETIPGDGIDEEALKQSLTCKETPTERMMRIALEGDNLEALKELITLKNQEEDRNCRKAFDLHFAQMQRELVPVLKNRDGSKTKGGEVTFKYAPLEDIEKANRQIITDHGFSYRWREEERENGEKRIRLIISGWGWTDDETYFDVPKIATNSLTTDVQTRGMQSSYGRRYTFISGFGITVEGEDDETKLGFNDSLLYSEYIARVVSCKTLDQLKFEMADIWKKLGTDHKGKQALNEFYKKKSAELEGDSSGTKN